MMVVFKMRDSVPSVRYSSICNVLRLWTRCKINGGHVAIGDINISFVTYFIISGTVCVDLLLSGQWLW